MSWGVYYGLDVDCASHVWEEFGSSISQTNLTNGVSSIWVWSLILQEVYNQEHILVPSGVKTIEFLTIDALRFFVDDPSVFSQCFYNFGCDAQARGSQKSAIGAILVLD